MHLLLVSIDSLRWDYVSRIHPQVHTPAFDRLTAHFFFTDRFFAVSSATRPVHASLLTGLYPFEHGVLGMHYPAMRPDIPHLFALCEQAGYQVRAYSQAPGIFTGLDFARWIRPYQAAQTHQDIRRAAGSPTCLFLHYWDTHTPYGATDGKALGETLTLLKEGHTHIVQQRYIRAIETLFEQELTPLLAQLDLSEWCVIILSDHGESWTEHEPYHGQTLNNTVLRIPLYCHIPHSGNPAFARPLNSQIDLLPTLINLLQLPAEYQGFGRDLSKETGTTPPYYLAQIEPLESHDDVAVFRSQMEPGTQHNANQQWALFNQQIKYVYTEKNQRGQWTDPFTDLEIESPHSHADFAEAYATLKRTSQYQTNPGITTDQTTERMLEQRLRDLGYLE